MMVAIISGIAIIPMDLSGDGTKEIVKQKAGVTRELIHEHEEMAEKAVIVFGVTSVLAIAWFICKKKKPSFTNKIEIFTLIMAIISMIIVAQAAHLGGMIRHDELRPDIENK